MSEEASADNSEAVKPNCTFFKPKVRRGNAIRQRKTSSDESDGDESGTSVVKKVTERKRLNGIVQATVVAKKWKTEDDTVGVAFASSAQKTGPCDQGATATIEIDTELEKDARSIFERAQKINKELKGKDDDKVYRGIHNYTQYIAKKDSAAGSAAKMRTKGPLRAPTNIRSTVRWDYQPDICKDFKETGFCGFGDSCIFMHDRSDYKHGWQMDREWDEKHKKKKHNGDGGDDEDDDADGDEHKYEIPSDEEDLPFACFICREDFVNPVATKCGHFFCEKCALANFKKSNRCFVCAKPTGGVFNPAHDLEAKLRRRKELTGDDEAGPSIKNDSEEAPHAKEASAASDADGDEDEDEGAEDGN